jgi:sterol desaturase/sphingolipid hydroxylase (fatty acid hydroxylase superfamily)
MDDITYLRLLIVAAVTFGAGYNYWAMRKSIREESSFVTTISAVCLIICVSIGLYFAHELIHESWHGTFP